MNASPRVSVILAVYNGQSFLDECLNSIRQQTFADFECIIVDDASTDATSDILQRNAAEDSRIIVLTNEQNLERSASRNRAIEQARADLVAVMDADDVASLDRLEKQYAFMVANPEITVCGSFYTEIPAGRLRDDLPQDNDAIKATLLFEDCIAHPTVMFRRKQVHELGGYSLQFPLAEDYDLWCRLALHEDVRFACIPEMLLYYRTVPAAGRRTVQRQVLYARQIRAKYHEALGIDLTSRQRALFEMVLVDRVRHSSSQRRSVFGMLPAFLACCESVGTVIKSQALEAAWLSTVAQIKRTAVLPALAAFMVQHFPSMLKRAIMACIWFGYAVFLQNLPSALGSRLRSLFLRQLLKRCGTSPTIHPHVVLRSLSNISIGDNVELGTGTRIEAEGQVLLGNNVVLAADVLVLTRNPSRANGVRSGNGGSFLAPVAFEDDTWVGARATILPGVTVARGCLVAAGAVVAKSTQPYGVYGGVPAKRIKDR